jgi:microtubule-associated protein-like 6
MKDSAIFRDETWSTGGIRTNALGWATQGIALEGKTISLAAMPEVGDIVTGCDDGKVKLYRYPNLALDSLCQTYCGHAGPVAKVRVSNSKRYVASIGCHDRTILLWKHEIELADESGSDSECGSDEDLPMDFDVPNELPEVVTRTALQEAVSRNADQEEIVAMVQESYASRGEKVPHHSPWKSAIMEPSSASSEGAEGTTDVDFELAWMHGYRSHDSRNNLRYTSSGKIVYAGASLGVVLNKSTGKQQFLQAAHSDEIIGITGHPNGACVCRYICLSHYVCLSHAHSH